MNGKDEFALGELDPRTVTIMCESVFNRSREIAYVDNDYDGPQAVCDLDHSDEAELCASKVVLLKHIFEWEPNLAFLKNLKLGQFAIKTNAVWEIGQLEEE